MKLEKLYIVTKPGPAAIVVDDLCYGNGLTVTDFQLCTLGGLNQNEIAAVFTTRDEQRGHARELLIAKLEERRASLLAAGSTGRADRDDRQDLESISNALVELRAERALVGFFGEVTQ